MGEITERMKTTLLKKTVTIAGLFLICMTVFGFAQANRAGAAAAPVVNPDQIINTGKKYLGVKYRFGAPSNVTYAFDCSSFTQFIFKKNGVSLPRTSSEQAKKGVFVSKASLQKGDLVFFRDPGRPQKIGHVAVYAGNDKMLGASGKAVKFSSMASSYWTKHYVTARRVIAAAPPAPAALPPVLKLPAAETPPVTETAADSPVPADAPAAPVAEDQPGTDAVSPAVPGTDSPAMETPAATAALSAAG